MELPVLNGLIDRRILINYRVRPEVVKKLLPAHLEPLVINGYASAGICLLRLKNIGIKHSPQFLRITSENAAHRFLVTYTENGSTVQGVYIPRRDTDSMLNVLLAGKMFSWPHYRARFSTSEGSGRYSVSMKSGDRRTYLDVEAEPGDGFPPGSMFNSLEHASLCFRNCPTGISPSTIPNKFKAIVLKTETWSVTPLHVRQLRSSFYEDTAIFPNGTIAFDNALLMRGIEHEWHSVAGEMIR